MDATCAHAEVKYIVFVSRECIAVASLLALLAACGDQGSDPEGSSTFGTSGEVECPEEDREAPEPPWAGFALGDTRACAIDFEGRVGCQPDLYDLEREHTCTRGRAVGVAGGGPCIALSAGGVRCFEHENVEEAPDGTPDAPRLYDRVATSGFGNFYCALDTEGAIACHGWMGGYLIGATYWNTTPTSAEYTDVVAGDHHACALRVDGRIGCWGAGSQESPPPVDPLATDFYGQAMPPAGQHIAIAAEGNSSCSVQADGRIFCWGQKFSSGEGEHPLGDEDGDFIEVAMVGERVCGLRENGSVQCNVAASDLIRAAGDRRGLQLSRSRACARTSAGEVECWGVGAWSFDPPD